MLGQIGIICVDQVSNFWFFLGGGKSQKPSLDFSSAFLSSSRSIPDDLIPGPSAGSAANISRTILRSLINASQDKEDGEEKESGASKRFSRKDSQTAEAAQNYCNSPRAIPRCKYTSQPHPKTLARCYKSSGILYECHTPREGENDCVAKRTGEEEERSGRQTEKKNHFDGLRPL